MTTRTSRVMAILGKGGAGKTVFSALAARSILDAGLGPLLLVDADPTGGLAYAVGAGMDITIGQVREKIIRDAADPEMSTDSVVNAVDWLMLDALQERGDYSLLAMGRTDTKGCFCPVNTLLRTAIEKLAGGFRMVLLDAEAGIEQVNRQVVRQVDIPVVVTDGSVRGLKAAEAVAGLLGQYRMGEKAYLVINRTGKLPGEVPSGLTLLGTIPDDEDVRERDGQGGSLLDLPEDNPARKAVREMVRTIMAPGGSP